MKLKLWSACWMVINGALLVSSARINPTSPQGLQGLDSEQLETGIDTEKALDKWRDLKARLLKLKSEHVSDDGIDEDSTQERHIRTLFPAGYAGCSCSDLAAIAAQITIFEDEVKGIDDLENKISLIATAIKKLGLWVESGVVGPQGHEGPPGPPGITGRQGNTGNTGSDTQMNREGVPGPQGTSGPSGQRGVKGPTGDCIKGQKGTGGKAGESGVGIPGRRGPSGPPGLPGAPGPELDAVSKNN